MGEIADDDLDRLWDNMHELDDLGEYRPPLVCRRCGSDDVRWRLQGGKWVLFNLGVGKHVCPIDDSSFTASE